MIYFTRKVNLLELFKEHKLLVALLKYVKVTTYEYNYEVTYYYPGNAGKLYGHPDSQYPAEPPEIEFEPMFGLEYEAKNLYLEVYAKIKKVVIISKFILWMYKAELYITFIENEREWALSEEAEQMAYAAAIEYNEPEFDF